MRQMSSSRWSSDVVPDGACGQWRWWSGSVPHCSAGNPRSPDEPTRDMGGHVQEAIIPKGKNTNCWWLHPRMNISIHAKKRGFHCITWITTRAAGKHIHTHKRPAHWFAAVRMPWIRRRTAATYLSQANGKHLLLSRSCDTNGGYQQLTNTRLNILWLNNQITIHVCDICQREKIPHTHTHTSNPPIHL